jgi:hypothetical protein
MYSYYDYGDEAVDCDDLIPWKDMAMPALIGLGVLLALAALVAICWRWLDMIEKVKLAREKAGGVTLLTNMEDLTKRVAKLEGYVTGTAEEPQ